MPDGQKKAFLKDTEHLFTIKYWTSEQDSFSIVYHIYFLQTTSMFMLVSNVSTFSDDP